jgi:hypothetical protein
VAGIVADAGTDVAAEADAEIDADADCDGAALQKVPAGADYVGNRHYVCFAASLSACSQAEERYLAVVGMEKLREEIVGLASFARAASFRFRAASRGGGDLLQPQGGRPPFGSA